MVCKLPLAVLAVAGVCAVGLTDTATKPAQAKGFFNGGGFAAQRYSPRLSQRSHARRPSYGSPFWWGGSSQPQYPQVKAYVSSPKYFTYKPDLLNQISFKALAETKVAAAGPLPTQVMDAAFDAARAEFETFEMQALPEVGAALIAHYKRYPEFLWVDKGHVNARAYEAITALKGAERFGLSSEDYAVELPASSAAPASSAQIELSLIAFEFTMSVKVLTFVLDANRGRINPNRLSGYHDFERKKIDLAAALVEIVAATDIASYLDAQSPDNEAFAALASELEELRGLETPQTIEIADGTFLRPGEQSPELFNIVAAIKQSGSAALLEEHQAALDAYADGSAYGEDLVALVKGLQKGKGLSVDGVIGKNTIRAMVPESNAGKIAKIEFTMERLRWLPRQLGPRHVFIDQPAFKVTYFEPGKDPLSMRVVVGKKSNQTNFFMDKIEKVEYNPYWGVPRSIIVNEMLPQLYADPSYLDRAGYEVSDASGRRVSSSSVNFGAALPPSRFRSMCVSLREQEVRLAGSRSCSPTSMRSTCTTHHKGTCSNVIHAPSAMAACGCINRVKWRPQCLESRSNMSMRASARGAISQRRSTPIFRSMCPISPHGLSPTELCDFMKICMIATII